MKKTVFLCNLCLIVLFVACSRYPADVERALKLAGDNRVELEKVLEHYSQRPEDNLKLRSAYFLIANMPYHFAVHDARLESFKTYLRQREPQAGMSADYEKTFGPVRGTVEIKPDLYYITSEFLIRNIDFSFQVWQETPWGKYISFDDFCEDILPYRLSREPLEYWKEEYYATFRPIIDTMPHNHLPEEVGMQLLQHINDQGWTFENNWQTQGFGASILLQKRFGNCKEQAEFVAYTLRSVGIPSGIDIYIQSPIHIHPSHFWNYTRNIEGKHVFFDYHDTYQLANDKVKRRTARKFGKIYRQSYALQKESLPVKYKNKYLPPGGLKNVLLHDVSFAYFPETHISIRLEPRGLFSRKALVYLCVFNDIEWIPIAGRIPENNIAEFLHVEPDILYQLRFIEESKNTAASKPFIFRENGSAQFIDADTTALQTMTLLRKFMMPTKWPHYVTRSVNGKFQGANQADFSDSITLHIIQKEADLSYQEVHPEHHGRFRYVRYLSADGGHNNMAEVRFYSDGKPLTGKVIGTDGAKDDFPNSSKDAVYDDDPLSFFDALEADEAWAGLELDKPYQIDAIRYIFRNDDNNIRPGDTYELLYLNNDRWLSAGRQTADTLILQYDNIPANTLYWLRNHTRGKEERPFTYENGKQVWW